MSALSSILLHVRAKSDTEPQEPSWLAEADEQLRSDDLKPRFSSVAHAPRARIDAAGELPDEGALYEEFHELSGVINAARRADDNSGLDKEAAELTGLSTALDWLVFGMDTFAFSALGIPREERRKLSRCWPMVAPPTLEQWEDRATLTRMAAQAATRGRVRADQMHDSERSTAEGGWLSHLFCHGVAEQERIVQDRDVALARALVRTARDRSECPSPPMGVLGH